MKRLNFYALFFVLFWSVTIPLSAQSYRELNGVVMKITGCERWVNGAKVYYTVTNNSGTDKTLKFNYLGDCCDGEKPEPSAIDDLGQSHRCGPVALGEYRFQRILGYMEATIPDGVTLKGVYEIQQVNQNASKFQKITIGIIDLNNKTKHEYVWNNIDITTRKTTNADNVSCNLPTMFINYNGITRVKDDISLNFTMTNNSGSDFNYNSRTFTDVSAYSSEGDSFSAELWIAGKKDGTFTYNENLPNGIAVKCYILIKNVPQNINSFSLVRFGINDSAIKFDFKDLSLNK